MHGGEEIYNSTAFYLLNTVRMLEFNTTTLYHIHHSSLTRLRGRLTDDLVIWSQIRGEAEDWNRLR